jgi:hypothetical protein
MLCYDDKNIDDFVEYLSNCEKEPTQKEMSSAIGISIEVCKEKLPLVLRLNHYFDKHYGARRRYLSEFLN